ncbi:ABC transporter substrate-binding protein [Nakamurella antarctica]|nr:extracellular solute-binding protein [Nakamurella antarctica]
MAGLEAAANKEGKLNVIALPRDWANYGAVLDAFMAKYPGIKVEEQAPNSSSKEEIAAAEINKGTDKAPDVFDLGTSVTLGSLDKFAPYKVAAWDKIPELNKEATGLWTSDYTGIMAVGYNSTKFGEITSLDQLFDPKFKGVVAVNGNPNEAGAAYNGVVMASLANGGSLDDITPGVNYFKKLNDAGNMFLGDVTSAVVTQGEVGVVIDWSYLQTGYAQGMSAEGTDWKTFVPEGAAIGSYYNQAINLDAPNPAAARLWQEFLYTPEAQNLWLAGGARPILLDTMIKDKTVDQASLDALGGATPPVSQTAAQTEKSKADLLVQWKQITG